MARRIRSGNVGHASMMLDRSGSILGYRSETHGILQRPFSEFAEIPMFSGVCSNLVGLGKMESCPTVKMPSFFQRVCAVWHKRCPRCLQGPIYERGMTMHARCPVCGLRLEREQGYFMGAMYISYA